MVNIRSLVWDNWNRDHIKKHNVSEKEVEEICKGSFKRQPTYNSRYLIFGRTKGKRLLTICLAKETNSKYYVITARDMSKKERREFAK